MPDHTEDHIINEKKLQAWIYEYFSESDLNAICFSLDIDFENIRQKTRQSTTIALIQYCRNRGLSVELANHAQKERPLIVFPNDIFIKNTSVTHGKTPTKTNDDPKGPIMHMPVNDAALIPFTNREDEIERIMSSYAAAYYLLDAPAGYGKTELLKELARRFTERGWDNVYISINGDESFESLVSALADKFNVTSGFKKKDRLPPEYKLSSALKESWDEEIEQNRRKEGIVLLLDFDKKPSLQLIHKITDNLVPAIQDNLSLSAYTKVKHNPFRVILTGRYLAGRQEIRLTTIRLKVIQLSPFDFNVIRDSISKYLTNNNQSDAIQASRLASHLLYLTGGHPGGIAKTLNMYRDVNVPPDRFLQFRSDDVWKSIIRDFVLDIEDGIANSNPDLFKVIEKLSVFRYVDYKILEILLGEEDRLKFNNQYDLAEKLTETYLLAWNGRFLKDGIMRRLLAIKLRHQKPVEFENSCANAMILCAQRVQEPKVQNPELWTIEYLFQFLQQHANNINDKRTRKKINQHFLDEIIQQAIQLYIIDRGIPSEDWRAEKYALNQAMESDWEFRFTVNYYLRTDQYNDEPFARIQQKIEDYFEAL